MKHHHYQEQQKKNRFQNNGLRLQKMTSKVRKLNNITKKT